MDRLPPENLETPFAHKAYPKVDSGSVTSHLFSKITKNLLSKFKNRFFTGKSDISPLQGRIHELHKVSMEKREQLEQIKREVDLDLQPLVSEVIDPLLRTIYNLHTQQHNDLQEWQEKALPRYAKWVNKAKLWVDLYTKAQSKEEVLKAIIEHIIDLSSQSIEKDLKILKEYETHALNFSNDPEKKAGLQKELKERLAPFLTILNDLKVQRPPEFKELKEVSAWKAGLDEKRQHCFNEALQTIDSFAEEHK